MHPNTDECAKSITSVMALDPSSFTLRNTAPDFSLPEEMDFFSLTAPPNSTISRKPPSRDTLTAPMLYSALRFPFVVAEVTVSAHWECEWDQAGLIIFNGIEPGETPLPSPRPVHSSNGPRDRSESPPGKWVKAGLEFTAGKIQASSVVASSDGSDLSLSPLLLPPVHAGSYYPTPYSSLRIKFERIGPSLWVWYKLPNELQNQVMGLDNIHGEEPISESPEAASEGWLKLREVGNFFSSRLDDKATWVGVYASRPFAGTSGGLVWDLMHGTGTREGEGGRGLVVDFENLEIF